MNTENLQKKRQYICGLDALRGIAVLGVIFYHLIPGTVPGGFLGVNMFFVLSGYLISRTTMQEWNCGTYSIRKFYKKRCRRILPPLICMVGMVSVFMHFVIPEIMHGKRAELCSIFLGYNNLWQIRQNASYFARMGQQSPFTHLWATAVEMQFYLIWPVFFAILRWLEKKYSGRAVERVLLALVIFGGMGMCILYQPEQDVSRLYYGTDTRIFAFILGILTARVQPQFTAYLRKRIRQSVRCCILGIVMLFYLVAYFVVEGQMAYVYQGGLFLSSLVCAAILLLLDGSGVEQLLEKSPLTGIGKISYELYLWMYPVIFTFGYYKKNYGPEAWCLQLVWIAVLAGLQYMVTGFTAGGGKDPWKKRLRRVVAGIGLVLVFALSGREVTDRWQDGQPEKTQYAKAIRTEEQTGREQQIGTCIEMKQPAQQPEKDKPLKPAPDKQEHQVTAIGDSVLLGADEEVENSIPNCIVDAKESRQVVKTVKIVETLKQENRLGDIVILALGTNGTFSEKVGEKLLETIGAERQIYWVTVYGQHLQWQEDTNHRIRQMADTHSNVHVIDWDTEAQIHPEWFVSDGVHLTNSGQEAYAGILQKGIDAALKQ